MIENEIGEPISSVIVFATSSWRAWISWEIFSMMSARSAGVMRGHGPASKARRAACTARSTSSVDASGTVAMTSSVSGEITSMVDVPAGSTHSPSM